MSDWRQIQARIRKAKTSSDPVGQLSKLFDRTRDAMVAFELAGVEERAGNSAEAIRWYTVAAQRFRRADWKTKAHDGLTRLGAAISEAPATEPSEKQSPEVAEVSSSSSLSISSYEYHSEPLEPMQLSEASDEFFDRVLQESASSMATSGATPSAIPSSGVAPLRRKRHRGRRGGRGRHKGKVGPPAGSVSQKSPNPAGQVSATSTSLPASREAPPPLPDRPVEPSVIESQLSLRGRAGDPALASRLAPLESQLRRLLAASPHSVGDTESAPAGPGVFLVSDSDQITYYYVENCQTLRIGVSNLLRERRGRADRESLRARLAEHLGIPEARVTKYLKDYCVVRWLQLDDGASPLAHFAIAVLRPALND